MKNLYKINKFLIITNIVLGFTIYAGLLFLIPLGIIQIMMSLIIAFNRKQLNNDTMILFRIYTVVSTGILTGIILMYFEFIPITNTLFVLGLSVSIIMAFLHLKITHLIQKL